MTCNSSLMSGNPRPLLPDSAALRPDDVSLRVVDMKLSQDHVCLPQISPSLLDRTLRLLPKPWNLKLSTDGPYRLMFDSYVLLIAGVNVKNWSVRKDLNIWSFRGSFLLLVLHWQTRKMSRPTRILCAPFSELLRLWVTTCSQITSYSGMGICTKGLKLLVLLLLQMPLACWTGRMSLVLLPKGLVDFKGFF